MASDAANIGYIPPHRRGKQKSTPSVENNKAEAAVPSTVDVPAAMPVVSRDIGDLNTERRYSHSPASVANGWAEKPAIADASTEWHEDKADVVNASTERGGRRRNRRNTTRQPNGNDGPTDGPTSNGSTRGSVRGGNRGRGRGRGAHSGELHNGGPAPNNNTTRAGGWLKHVPKGRNNAWAASKQIPKVDPNRHKVKWDSVSEDSSDSYTGRPSSGWGTHRKRTDGQSPPLADFTGGWAPAPVDWDSRPGFRDGQSAHRIEQWVDETQHELSMVENPCILTTIGGFSFSAPEADLNSLDQYLQGEAAPRYWIPQTIESKTAKCFWKDYIRSAEPEPVDEDDLMDVQPWWQRYQGNGCSFLTHLSQPNVEGPDPTETEDERLKRENDRGSNSVREDKVAYEKAKKAAHLQRQAQKQQRLKQQAKAYALDQRADKIRPGLHVVLRSATVEDAKAIRDIYNQYVDHTVVVQEIDRVTEANMAQRIRASKASKLPFIVAYQRGEKAKNRNKNYNNGEDLYRADTILGFAYANDYFDAKGVWRFTATLEIYVSPNSCNKGIGSCLLDKMMSLLDLTYIERRGYETVGEELDGAGASRNLVTLLVQYLYDTNQPERMEWVSKWLQRKAGFEKGGDLNGVAHKFDKMLSFAVLQRTSGSSFNATNPPITM